MERLFVGKNIIKLSSIDSTNNYAIQLLRQSVINDGDVVISDDQKTGKGQRGNIWVSEPKKNLTFSIVFKPKFLQAQNQFYLTKAISLALCLVLTQILNKRVEVKWPNDIYVGAKKIAGILIENTIQNGVIKNSIVGIGLNVNQSYFEGLSNATSLFNEYGEEFELDKLLSELLISIEQHYIKLKANHLGFDALYLSKLKGYQEELNFQVKNENMNGFILGVNKMGQLEVAINNEKHTFNMKEIVFTD